MSEVIDKLIDDIIELIIGDMCCYHEEDREEDGTHVSVDYGLNNETKLRGMIGELIDKAIERVQKPEVTEEWIEEKAKRLEKIIIEIFPVAHYHTSVNYRLKKFKDFICSLVEEIHGRK